MTRIGVPASRSLHTSRLVYAGAVSARREPNDHVARDDALPDVRDGLTRLERAILHELARAQREFAGRNVPSTLLYGRVVEHVNVGPREFQRALARLARRRGA